MGTQRLSVFNILSDSVKMNENPEWLFAHAVLFIYMEQNAF